MKKINIEEFEYAVSNLNDGFLFEKFAQAFLSGIIGADFIPVGGTKDKGLDGFERVYYHENKETHIYQVSTEKDVNDKIMSTIVKLQKNNKNFEKLVYVTNRKINNKDVIEDEVFDSTKKRIRIYDISWFVNNVVTSSEAFRSYEVFVKENFHTYNKPGKETVITDFVGDPRVYVFLKQQLDERKFKGNKLQTIDVLADSLILYSLEGTNPDKQIFKTRDDLKTTIREFIKFDPKYLFDVIDGRLEELSSKPFRKIRHHQKEDKFCLPFETRNEINSRDILDKKLYSDFKEESLNQLRDNLDLQDTIVQNAFDLIETAIHKIFYEQGLEFSNFILSEGSEYGSERSLNDIINSIVESSSVIGKNKGKVKKALFVTIREIIYNSTYSQREFLKKLSSTYMMMFMMNWEPKIANFFNVLASELNIYVGNSVLIPALSEMYLKNENRRHWNLLVGANKSGVTLYVNDKIIDELSYHIKMIHKNYISYYRDVENEYLSVDDSLVSVDEILIRAYFYAKKRDLVYSFEDYLDSFISPDLKTIREDLIEFLKNQFGIKFVHSNSLNINIKEEELDKLVSQLAPIKGSEKKARTDAWQILSIYAMREKYNEVSDTGIFGYKTWWLSKDTNTFASVKKVLKERYPTSCYIRPDFLYNYISLSPNQSEVDSTFKELFPTMLGVNLSYHLPDHITSKIKSRINEHSSLKSERASAILRRLTEEIKSDPQSFFDAQKLDEKRINKFLDEAVKDI